MKRDLRIDEGDAAPFSLVTHGRASAQVRHEPSDFAAGLDDEDRSRLR